MIYPGDHLESVKHTSHATIPSTSACLQISSQFSYANQLQMSANLLKILCSSKVPSDFIVVMQAQFSFEFNGTALAAF